jgi:hypothetical protein
LRVRKCFFSHQKMASLPNVMGKGLECRTVLVFPPGKSWHARVCASRLFGFATVYRA